MKELVIALGGAWALAVILGRVLLVDEMKGWMSSRRNQAVEEALASLSEDERDLFEEDWRATYAKYKDRPLSAWRCAREFTQSARNLARDRAAVDATLGFDDVNAVEVTRRDGDGRGAPSALVQQLTELAKSWTDIEPDGLGAPFPRRTLRALVPILRPLKSMFVCSAIVSGGGMFLALQEAIRSGSLLAAAASIAFVIAMLSMDRLMALSILSRGGSFLSAMPRVLLTTVTLLAVAQLMVIRVFSSEIEHMIPSQAGHTPSVFQAMRALDTLGAKYPSVLVMRWALTAFVVAIGLAPVLGCLLAGGRIRKLRLHVEGAS